MEKTGSSVSYQTAAARKIKMDKYYKMASLFLFFLLWEAFCRINLSFGWVNEKFLPMPTGIIGAAVSYIEEGLLWEHVLISVRRVLKGYLSGVFLALILGSLIASFRLMDNLFSPLLNLFGPIPVMAFLPVFILWFGIGEISKSALIAYTTAIYMVSCVTEGIRNTEPVLIRSASSLGATQWQIFWKVKFQSAFPGIFLGMKGALGAAFGAMVVAEMMGASTGLGYIIVFSKNWFKMNDMIMAAVLIGLLYSLFFAVLTVIESNLFRWKILSKGGAVEK
ncbi:ABC transporter permease [Lachnospiraceae bacterium 54-53]